MLNFLRFDEVDYSLSLPKLPLVTNLEQDDPSVEKCSEQASAVVKFFGSTTMQ
jgi:hypothetical protein